MCIRFVNKCGNNFFLVFNPSEDSKLRSPPPATKREEEEQPPIDRSATALLVEEDTSAGGTRQGRQYDGMTSSGITKVTLSTAFFSLFTFRTIGGTF